MNCMSSSPLERLRTSSACQAKPTAADSGGGTICAITSFLASARATVGAMPVARMPAMPAFTSRRRPTDGRLRLVIFMIVVMAPSQAIRRFGRDAAKSADLREAYTYCAAIAMLWRPCETVKRSSTWPGPLACFT